MWHRNRREKFHRHRSLLRHVEALEPRRVLHFFPTGGDIAVSEQYSLVGSKLYDNVSGELVHTFVSPDPERDADIYWAFPTEVALTDNYAVINDYVFSLNSFAYSHRLRHQDNPKYDDDNPDYDGPYYDGINQGPIAADGGVVLADASLYSLNSGVFIKQIADSVSGAAVNDGLIIALAEISAEHTTSVKIFDTSGSVVRTLTDPTPATTSGPFGTHLAVSSKYAAVVKYRGSTDPIDPYSEDIHVFRYGSYWHTFHCDVPAPGYANMAIEGERLAYNGSLYDLSALQISIDGGGSGDAFQVAMDGNALLERSSNSVSLSSLATAPVAYALGGGSQLDRIVLDYTVPPGTTYLTVRFYASADGRLTSADPAAGFSFTLTQAALESGGMLELLDEEPSRAFVGDTWHRLSINPAGTPLRGLLENQNIQVLYAVLNPGSINLDALPPDRAVAFRGFYQAEPQDYPLAGSRIVVRTGDGDEDVQVNISGDFDEFWFEGEESGRVTEWIDPSEGIDVLVLTADGDDLVLTDADVYQPIIAKTGRGADCIIGGGYDDYLDGGPGSDALFGEPLDLGLSDVIDFVTAARDMEMRVPLGVFQGYGDDVLIGGDGFDFILGGDGNDQISGGPGGGILIGDSIGVAPFASFSFTNIFASEANANPGTDAARSLKLSGLFDLAAKVMKLFPLTDSGDDVITGGTGIDFLLGCAGNDKIYTGGGLGDVVFGNDGNDILQGGASRINILVGGSGDDQLVGNAGSNGIANLLIGDDFDYLGSGLTPKLRIDLTNAKLNSVGIKAGIAATGTGADKLVAASGFNVMIGGNGNDTFEGGDFFNFMLGDTVNLSVDFTINFAEVYNAAITGDALLSAITKKLNLPGLSGTGDDTIYGGAGIDIALGGDGKDTINGGAGTVDILLGNKGDDTIKGDVGFNLVIGGEDNDKLTGGNDGNLLLGDTFSFAPSFTIDIKELKNKKLVISQGLTSYGSGADVITGGSGFDFIVGGNGNDHIEAGNGFNVAFGDAFDFGASYTWSFGSLFSDAADVQGDPNAALSQYDGFGMVGNGNDYYLGGNDTDVAFGGAGNDELRGEGGWDFLVGGEGDDIVNSGPGLSFEYGGVVFGGPGNDRLYGGNGSDHMESEGGDDIFWGGPGDDKIYGGAGSDTLIGDAGNDQLFGEGDSDKLYGGAGTDTLTGGAGTNQLFPDNLAPVVASFGPAISYTENAAPIPITTTATVTDVDSLDFAGGKLTIKFTAGGQASDRLSIRTAGSISTSDNAVRYGGVTIGGFSGGTGTTPLVINLYSTANTWKVQALLRNIVYRDISENPSTVVRKLAVQLADGDGGVSTAVLKDISVAPVNDAPVLAGISGSVNYVHDAAAFVLAGTATVADVDSANVDSGTLRVRFTQGGSSANRLAIGGSFTVDASKNVKLGSTVIGTLTSNGEGTNELVITFKAAATPSIVQQLVRAIKFSTVSGSAGVRKIGFMISDGDGGSSAELIKTVNVT